MTFETFIVIEIPETTTCGDDRRQFVRDLFEHAFKQPIGIRPIFFERLLVIETNLLRFALRDTAMLDSIAERLRRIEMIRKDTQLDMLPVHLMPAAQQSVMHSRAKLIEREIAMIQHALNEYKLVRIEQRSRFKDIEMFR